MSAAAAGRQEVRIAYDALAPAYDLFTREFAHDRWLAEIETLAIEYGLSGRRVLDVACGTGKSFLPLLRRGYDITACDISQAMLDQARAKAPGARLVRADMRALPDLGHFDLVTCLDDALNYVETERELRAALRSLRRCLAPEGLAIWDVNTLSMYRGAFARTWATEEAGRLVLWRGGASRSFVAGDRAHAVIDVFQEQSAGWRRSTSRHEQRHWPVAKIAETAGDAGLTVLEVLGQRRGARLDHELDENVHPKALFLACRDDQRRKEVPAMRIGSP